MYAKIAKFLLNYLGHNEDFAEKLQAACAAADVTWLAPLISMCCRDRSPAQAAMLLAPCLLHGLSAEQLEVFLRWMVGAGGPFNDTIEREILGILATKETP